MARRRRWRPQGRLRHYLQLTKKVCGTARRRVLLGETVPNEEKIFSIFEPHTELIKRGKQPDPIQYGHKVLVIEDAAGFICHYEVMANGVLDQDMVVPAMTKLQKRFAGKIERASFDRAFTRRTTRRSWPKWYCIRAFRKKAKPLAASNRRKRPWNFVKHARHHPGVESAIGALQSGNGQERCRDKSKRGYERYVGLGILGRNLHVLGNCCWLKTMPSARRPSPNAKASCVEAAIDVSGDGGSKKTRPSVQTANR